MRQGNLRELAALFLRLGVAAFGGPAAHIGMMEDEVVHRRKWMSGEHFLDLVGATNLIPGPNSTEMTMHVGYERAGFGGLVVAGTCFIVPAAALTAALAYAYVMYGTLPDVAPLLIGIKPVVIVIIASAMLRLGKHAVKSSLHLAVGVGAVVATLVGTNEIVVLLAASVAGAVLLKQSGRYDASTSARILPMLFLRSGSPVAEQAARTSVGLAAATAAGISLWKLGLFFLKVGCVLYGSGYVLVAFLEGDLVERYGWLTQAQLLDAVAVGQFTPGPVLTTATFIGYVLQGWEGAIVSTLAIFLPAFAFVAFLNPLIPKLRESAWASAFLDALNVAAVGLMAAVAWTLGVAVLTSMSAWLIAIVAAVLLLRFRVNAVWLVLGGGVVGAVLAKFVDLV